MQLDSKDKLVKELRVEGQSEKNEMGDKIESLKSKNQGALDELTQKKIEFEREKALKNQQL